MNPLKALKKDRPAVGDVAADGSIYLGKHKGKHWFATAEDARGADGKRLQMTFNAASAYAKNLSAHGRNDWSLPDMKILRELFGAADKGAFKGTFETRSYWPHNFYWTSELEKDPGTTRMQTGHIDVEIQLAQRAFALKQDRDPKKAELHAKDGSYASFPVRCVRAAAKLP
jgi:hypothetical protein